MESMSNASSTEASRRRTVPDIARRWPAVMGAGRYPLTRHRDATVLGARHLGAASDKRVTRSALRRRALIVSEEADIVSGAPSERVCPLTRENPSHWRCIPCASCRPSGLAQAGPEVRSHETAGLADFGDWSCPRGGLRSRSHLVTVCYSPALSLPSTSTTWCSGPRQTVEPGRPDASVATERYSVDGPMSCGQQANEDCQLTAQAIINCLLLT